MKRALPLLLLLAAPLAAQDKADPRLAKPKDYNGYFPWTPPTDLKAWEKRRAEVREQVLVANGLWPMWEKAPIKATIHGKIPRDGYTIEKVFFASVPGHYVTGNLYRPLGKTGKLPGVLCPHGHWANGRFYENGDKNAEKEVMIGAEKTKESAKYPLQARCAQLARLGCVVFHFDMVGNADSTAIPHRAGFTDVDAELWLHNFMGLQTFNSVRALDFIQGLPDVDPNRIGVTGASGGGTQTFILCAIDERPKVAFPAVMVSTAMQGGCICENASYLRVGTGNIELAAMMAPRPLAMSGANDWTVDIETKGLPQLKELYKLFGKEDLVQAKTWKEFGHNYNQVSREMMYTFFAKHLPLDVSTPIAEHPFVPVPPKELSVFDAEHPRPKDEANAERLRATLKDMHAKQLEEYFPRDEGKLKAMRGLLGPALRVMVGDSFIEALTESEHALRPVAPGVDQILSFSLSRAGSKERLPAQLVQGKKRDGRVVVWIHPKGISSLWAGDKLVPQAQQIIDQHAAILAVDVLRTGSSEGAETFPVNKGFAGYTFGYNRPLISERVRDIHTALAAALHQKGTKKVYLLGLEEAGPWTILARASALDWVERLAADVHGFHFGSIKNMNDPNMLPGALRYGGLLTLASLAAPHEMLLYNVEGAGPTRWLEGAYQAAGQPGRLTLNPGPAKNVVEWLLK